MDESFDILPLRPFTQAEIWPIIDGYGTDEIYAVEKTESDAHTLFDIRLVKLASPYQSTFFSDFEPEDCEWYQVLLQRGYSFGAYQGERLIGFALAEAFPDKRLLRVWEIHVLAAFRRMGFSLEAIDCSEYFAMGEDANQVAFYMKRRIKEADSRQL